mmetsp:Transcript_106464/g.159248  ORF Transcript_106464/g.159248 Transcript_106464/m.159248 type:complete len:80 (+) Transcript_106464:59-298(+)
MVEFHNTSRRYYPATKKDHEREPRLDHKYCECENEGMCTHNSTSRYVPAGGNGAFFSWVKNKDKGGETSVKSNWFGIHL